MSNGPISHSPKRSGRSRLSELLKPSPPVSRTASPGKPQSFANGYPNKAGDVSDWPLVSTTQTSPDSQSPLAVKSKGKDFEVVVGASPMKQNMVTQPQDPVNGMQKAQRRFSKAAPLRPSVPESASQLASNPTSNGNGEERTHTATRNTNGGLQRSASDLNLPEIRARADTATSTDSRPSIRSAVSEIGLATMANGELARPPATAAITKETKVSRRQSITNRLRSRSKPQPINLKNTGSVPELAKLPKAILSPKEQVANPMDSTASLDKTLRRSSWIIGSRSPSPSNRKLLRHKKSQESRAGSSMRNQSIVDEHNALQKSRSETNVHRPSFTRAETTETKKSKRPLSAILPRSHSFIGGSTKTSTINLPQSMSAERLPIHSPIDEVPEMPKSIPRSRLQTPSADTPKKKDELYTAFRGLDAEHSKFISKASSLKAQVVRAGLLPFLKNHADHPSTKNLRAEDLDRRVHILSKWWTSLINTLKQNSCSPGDRPTLLDAIAGVMTRPEWRLSLSTISNRNPSRIPISRSVSSLESATSDFLAESVLHNVRNIFVQNLLSQMEFVVERMSARTVPASIVTFCGKACAYAFFFCPGVADILVRLWSCPPDAIKRALKEAGALNKDYDPEFAIAVLSQNFPSHLQPFAVTSHAALLRGLRRRPKHNLTANSAYIPWNGPWVGRWCGRDSDLFFVFVKTAVALICELLPETTSPADLITVPCSALIQAQLIVVMDATIHRGSTHDPLEGLPPPSFDDVLGADAVVQPLPQRAPNTIRIMAENRLIMLLRECLFSATLSVRPNVRRTFAQIYTNTLKAVTRRVSLFDHNAFFTLCDFLDEAFVMLARFYKDEADPSAWLDWNFWFEVFQKMGDSHNTMSEVRLYTFIYGLWGLLVQSEVRRKNLCLDWLLAPEYFERQFNHWCPMVRAYYMRLLCWRVAREDGEASELSVSIYKALHQRMNTSWSWFLALQEAAKANETPALSSAPATPAPGRKLLIVRNDSGPSPASQMSWDSMMAAASSSASPNTYQRYTSLDPVMQGAGTTSKDAGQTSSPKKSWLRKMNPFASSPSPGKRSANESDTDSINSKTEVSTGTESPRNDPKRMSTMSTTTSPGEGRGRNVPNTPPRPAIAASFKFSLEWTDKAALVAKDRALGRPRLPQWSQHLVDVELVGMGRIKEPVALIKPLGSQIGPSKYCGRALAEWELLVRECQSFYERRRAEGITDIKWMETPTLGVESFRRPAG